MGFIIAKTGSEVSLIIIQIAHHKLFYNKNMIKYLQKWVKCGGTVTVTKVFELGKYPVVWNTIFYTVFKPQNSILWLITLCAYSRPLCFHKRKDKYPRRHMSILVSKPVLLKECTRQRTSHSKLNSPKVRG